MHPSATQSLHPLTSSEPTYQACILQTMLCTLQTRFTPTHQAVILHSHDARTQCFPLGQVGFNIIATIRLPLFLLVVIAHDSKLSIAAILWQLIFHRKSDACTLVPPHQVKTYIPSFHSAQSRCLQDEPLFPHSQGIQPSYIWHRLSRLLA